MTVIFLWMVQIILTAVLLCQPTSLSWDPNARGHCGDQTIAYSAVGVVDLITDVVILALPIRMVLRLQISSAHKIALSCIFGAGFM